MRFSKKKAIGIFVRVVGVTAALSVNAMAQYGGGGGTGGGTRGGSLGSDGCKRGAVSLRSSGPACVPFGHFSIHLASLHFQRRISDRIP